MDQIQNQLSADEDESWINFSEFLEKIFSFCNQHQNLLTIFSNVDHKNLIKECFNNFKLRQSIEQFTRITFKKLNDHLKDEQEAEKLRKDGNELFKDKLYSDALECYSAAILKAKQFDNDELDDHNQCCLSYANRSVVFFNLKQFEYALKDAEKAISLGHYDKDKLKNRIQKCKLALEQINSEKSDQMKSNEDSTNKASNEQFTNKKISLDYDDQKGRKLISNRLIEMGESLIKERAFISMVNGTYYLSFCNYCLSQLHGYGVPCKSCDYAIFCSEKCLNDALKEYHKEECGKISDLINHLGVGYLVLRLGFKVGFNNMISEDLTNKQNNFRSRSTKLTSTYKDVFNLMSHSDKFELKENLSFALVALFYKQVIDNYTKYKFTKDQSIKLCELFLHHIQQLSTNLISIDQEVSFDIYDNAGVEMNEKLNIGIGLYPVTSLLNHSCVPNVMSKFNGNHLEIKAIKFIEKNEELLFCYGPSFYEETKADRQKKLKDQYFFECKCTVCKSGEENKQRAYLCSRCNGAVILNKDKTNICLTCNLENQSVKCDRFNELIRLFQIAKRKFNSKKFEDALTDVNEAYTGLIDCVHRHNKEIRNCLDLMIECYVELGHYYIAIRYMEVNFKLIKEIFGLKSIESLIVFTKICNLYYLCENEKENLIKFINENLSEFESLEQEISKKVDNFKGFDELKIVKNIRSKI